MADGDRDTGGARPARQGREVGAPTESERRYILASEDAEEHVHAEAEPPAPRSSDVDPRAAKRSERTVAALFLLAAAAGIGFMVAFVFSDLQTIADVKWSNRWLGLSMAIAFLALGAGITHWVRRLMPQQELVQEREPLPSSIADKKAATDYFMAGAEATGVTKRPLVRRTLLAALVPLGVAPLFLLYGMGGNMPFSKLFDTAWRRGLRLVDYATGELLSPADLAVPGSIVTAIPEGYEHDLATLADSTLQVIKMRPTELLRPTRLDWTVDGIVAYSKICTHAGCATGLYEDTTHHIICPCHQSTFDASRGCKVIFGPASRPMPQLPLGVDPEGYLIAMDDFAEPPGPSFWEKGGQ